MADVTDLTVIESRGPGRPTVRTPELVERLLEGLANGIPLRQLCREEGVGWRTVYDWIEDDSDLAARFARARKAGYDVIAQEALDIADDSSRDTLKGERGDYPDTEWISRSKLRVETRLKLLAKWDPSRYGDKLDLTSAGRALPAQPVVFAAVFPSDAPDDE